MDYFTIELFVAPDAVVWLALVMVGCFFTALAFYGKYPPQFISVFWVLLFIQFTIHTLICFESGGMFNFISAAGNVLILTAGFISRLISSFKSNDHAHNETTH